MLTYVTGIFEGAGATVVTALMARRDALAGRRVHYVKLVQTGRAADAPGDADFVRRVVDVPATELARVLTDLEPAIGARRLGQQIPPEYLIDMVTMHVGTSDRCFVEGTGGLLAPLTGDMTLADLAAHTGGELVLVTDACPGALNATLCTIAAARTFALQLAGVVCNRVPLEPSPEQRDFLDRLQREVKVLACVPDVPGVDTRKPGSLVAPVAASRGSGS